MTLNFALPSRVRVLTRSPPKPSSQVLQSVHQLPGLSLPKASHSSGSAAGFAPIQWLRLFFETGLTIPATCPLAPSTKRMSPLSSCVVRYAVRQRSEEHTSELQ